MLVEHACETTLSEKDVETGDSATPSERHGKANKRADKPTVGGIHNKKLVGGSSEFRHLENGIHAKLRTIIIGASCV